MIKKGDTLIEVTLAIGIFSMVAVSVVAVMGNGTASAETALETTLTREEIDAQADALRFIHSSFLSDQNHEDDRYSKLWEAITKNALTLESGNTDIVTYSPETCDALYTKGENDTNSPLGKQNAFVVNTDYLGEYSNMDFTGKDENAINGIVDNTIISYNNTNNSSKFTIANTYPHLIYQRGGITEDQSALTDNFSEFARAEGIYVIAVKDAGTEVAGEDSFKTMSAFYDFYIRTCWYGVGDEFPSTVSTVIRLYNPDAIIARKINPDPESESTCDKLSGTMQDFAPTDNSCESGTLVDSRDGQEYTVAKIKDNYWMTRNLAIGCDGSGKSYSGEISSKGLTRNNSNIFRVDDSEWATPTANLSSGNSFDEARMACNSTYGGYYNFLAASAGTVGGPAHFGDATMDVCPKGWRLPSYSEISGIDDSTKSAFLPVYSGVYVGGLFTDSGKKGVWWTLEPMRQAQIGFVTRFALEYKNDSLQPWPYGRGVGASIRCIKRQGSTPTQETQEPQPTQGTYSLDIIDDNSDFNLPIALASITIRAGSPTGVAIDCSGWEGRFTCSGLAQGTKYYLFPTFNPGYYFNSWLLPDMVQGERLGDQNVENTYYEVGSSSSRLYLFSHN